MTMAIIYAQKYGSPPCSFAYPMMYHLKVLPRTVIVVPGNPKSIRGSLVNSFGKNCNIKYLKTVIKLHIITKSPPSLIHSASFGFFSTKSLNAFKIYSSLFTITTSDFSACERTIFITNTAIIMHKPI